MTSLKKNTKKILIPFAANGNMLCYAREGDRVVAEWRENKPFFATIAFQRITKGRSAVRGVFRDASSGAEYTMFLTELVETIPLLQGGEYTAKFRFVKRGANFGLVPIDTNPLEFLAAAADEDAN